MTPKPSFLSCPIFTLAKDIVDASFRGSIGYEGLGRPSSGYANQYAGIEDVADGIYGFAACVSPLVTQRDLYATTSVQELVDYVVHSANNIIEEDMDTGPTHGKLLRSQA